MAEYGNESQHRMDWTDPDFIFMSSDVVTGGQVPARRPRLPKPMYLLAEVLLERIEKKQYEPSLLDFDPAPKQKLLKHGHVFDWTAFAEQKAAPPFELNPDLSPAHGLDFSPDTPTSFTELDEALSLLLDEPSNDKMPQEESISEKAASNDNRDVVPIPKLIHQMDEDKENYAALPAENYNEKRVDQECPEPCKCPGHNLMEKVKALQEQNWLLRVQIEQLQKRILQKSRVNRKTSRRI